jgi:hypothetical protein
MIVYVTSEHGPNCSIGLFSYPSEGGAAVLILRLTPAISQPFQKVP